jgi:hypothetical protein
MHYQEMFLVKIISVGRQNERFSCTDYDKIFR